MSLPIQRAHLDGLVGFVAVAELRGFRAAARQLGVTPSAISQTIRALEQFNCIQLRRWTGSIFDWNFVEDGKRVKVPINGSLIVNDVEVCPYAFCEESVLPDWRLRW